MSEPANDVRAERSVVGAILHKPSVIEELAELQSEHFFKPVNGLVFNTLRAMYDEGAGIDPVTVFARLKESKDLLRVGGAVYLHECSAAFKSVENVGGYAKTVINAWALRRAMGLGQRLIQVHDEYSPSDIRDALDQVRRFLDETEEPIEDGSQSAYGAWQDWYNDTSVAMPTPWTQLNDQLAGGLHRGRVYIVGARPGGGKSVFAVNAMSRAAMCGYKGILFSLEMSKAEVYSRLLSAVTHVPMERILRRELTDDEKCLIDRAAKTRTDVRFEIDDRVGYTMEDITRKCRAYKRTHGLDIVGIDHSLLVEQSSDKMTEHQHVNHVARRAKLLAKELNCVVLVLQQLNRSPEQGEKRRAKLSDLYGGSEKDADVVIVLEPAGHRTDFQVIKNRTGKNNVTVSLSTEFDRARFS